MLGHIAVPALDPTGAPATLSAPMVAELLRARAGLPGPGGHRRHGDGGRARGLDGRGGGAGGARGRRLHPAAARARGGHPGAGARGARGPARPRRASTSRCLRILEAKERLGLRSQAPGGPRGRWQERGPARRTWSARSRSRAAPSPSCATRAACFRCAPRSRCGSCTSCCPATRATTPSRASPRTSCAARRIPRADGVPGARGLGGDRRARSWPPAAAFTHVLASVLRARVRLQGHRGHGGEPRAPAARAAGGGPAGRCVVSFGSPYLLRQVPEVPVYVCAYGGAESSQRAAVGALFGEYAVSGKAAGDAARLLSVRRTGSRSRGAR